MKLKIKLYGREDLKRALTPMTWLDNQVNILPRRWKNEVHHKSQE